MVVLAHGALHWQPPWPRAWIWTEASSGSTSRDCAGRSRCTVSRPHPGWRSNCTRRTASSRTSYRQTSPADPMIGLQGRVRAIGRTDPSDFSPQIVWALAPTSRSSGIAPAAGDGRRGKTIKSAQGANGNFFARLRFRSQSTPLGPRLPELPRLRQPKLDPSGVELTPRGRSGTCNDMSPS